MRSKFTLTTQDVSQGFTVRELVERYQVSRQTIYNALRANQVIPRARRVWSEDDKTRLKDDLLHAVPNDKTHGIKPLLARYGFTGIAEAYNVLKVKSLTELRTGSPTLHGILKKLGLKLHGNELYAPPRKRHTLWLSDDDLALLARDPIAWLREHKTEVKVLYK